MRKTFPTLLVIALSMMLSGCHLKPFVKYMFNNEGFKKFSKKELLAGNNENPHRAYQVNRYDWEVEVFPKKERIKGTMKISFTPNLEQNTFLFDLQKRMKIKSSSSTEEYKLKHKGDFLYLIFEKNQPAGKRSHITIEYEGKPHKLMGEGPIQWKKDDKDRPWISSITEGIGPHFMMPCNILLGNEADTTTINVTVPSELTVTANGQCTGIVEKGDKKTFSHLVTYPINIYNISFNIGHFVKLEKPYTDINGVERTIECFVMDYRKEVATEYYDQTPQILKIFEEMYGVFPWWNDGCRFVESTFAAMEHQSCIAMGDEYVKDWKDTINTTLVHEIAHEWWGNNVTGKDYCDIWIHEGMATYSEALFLEKFLGSEDYYKRIKKMVRSTYNRIPIHKKCGVVYNSWMNGPDQDIYDKGGLMMHSLRALVNNDSLFFSALKQIQIDFAEQNVSSEEMVEKLNTLLGFDYSPMMNWYLDEQQPPILEIRFNQIDSTMEYRWKREITLMQEQKISITKNGAVLYLNPSDNWQSINFISGSEEKKGDSIFFNLEEKIYYEIDLLEIIKEEK